jgi:hypothetical protein
MFSSGASTVVNPDWEAYPGFFQKDKAKQKEAISRFLSDKIRNDWEFEWPQARVARRKDGTAQESGGLEGASRSQIVSETSAANAGEAIVGEGDSAPLPVEDEPQCKPELTSEAADSEDNDDDDALSFYSSFSEDDSKFCYRTEWASELSGDEQPAPRSQTPDMPASRGNTTRAQEKKAARRREQRKEALWNEGLACFEARRNAWTGARTVRVRCRPASPPSRPPLSPRRIFFRSSTPASTAASPTPGGADTPPNLVLSASTASSGLDQMLAGDASPPSTPSGPVEVVLPIPPRLLPPSVMLKWSVSTQHYASIYDTIILQGRTPSYPINLGIILKSCVVGWKRDNEWPPQPTQPPLSAAARSQAAATQSQQSTRPRRRSFMQIVAGRGAQESSGSPRNGGWSKLMANIGVSGHDDANPLGKL